MDPSSKARAKRAELTVRISPSLHRWLLDRKEETEVPVNTMVARLISREAAAQQRQSA
ncbi:hypothetical protein [Paludisphaera soli]|uniref:hypothetical protein n=1 Tax=Paludisphaera soli TaxID=2712865 RepID=UPI0013EDC4D6|nr:hypothetical protein [Paludisphaera soli]